MRIVLNGKEADTGLDTRPITRADYDALSSSDKNLDVLYLVDNSVTRMTKSREAEFEWVTPSVAAINDNRYKTIEPPIGYLMDGYRDSTLALQNGNVFYFGESLIVSFGYRVDLRAVRFDLLNKYNRPQSVQFQFSDNSNVWSDPISVSPDSEELNLSPIYYLPNEETISCRFMKIITSSKGEQGVDASTNLFSFLISRQEDSEGSSGESYSRYVLYYHDTPLWRSEETIGEGMDFSTEEKVVGRWIDGKPLYQKVVQFVLPSAPFSGVELASLADLEIENVTSLEYVLKGTNGGARYFWGGNFSSLGGTNDSSSLNICVNEIVGGDLRLAGWCQNAFYGGGDVYCILRYTKTTDSPVDALTGSSSESSVVIDDQERLIGTWFGDPLYEIGITTYCYTSTTPVGSYGAIAGDFKIYGVDHVVELIGVVQNPANFNYNQRIEVPIPNSQCKVFPQFNFDSTGKTWISLCEQHSDSLYDSKPVRLRIRYTKQASS